MSDKSISNLPLTANASPDDLLLLSKKDGDQYVSYSIAKENLYNSNDFLSASESFLSSTVALSDINDNEIANYVKNDSFTADQLNALNSGITREKTSQIANIATLVDQLQLNGFGLSTITGTDGSGQQHTYEILMKEK